MYKFQKVSSYAFFEWHEKNFKGKGTKNNLLNFRNSLIKIQDMQNVVIFGI